MGAPTLGTLRGPFFRAPSNLFRLPTESISQHVHTTAGYIGVDSFPRRIGVVYG
jgi:hypothetical protein